MRSASLLAAAAFAAACGTEPAPALSADHPDNVAPPAPACTASVVAVSPATTAPVARGATIELRTDGPVDQDVKVVAVDADGPVPGEVVVGPGGVVLAPRRPFAAGPVSWEAIVCGAHLAGAFEVGALVAAVDDEDLPAFVGRSYAIDLRGGTWEAPAAKDGLDLVLRSLFGGAFVMTVDGAAPDRMTVAIGTGVVDASGQVVLDEGGSRYQTTTSLKDNPYVAVQLPSFSLSVDGRALTLAAGTLVLGMTPDGAFEDVRLQGEIDTRDFGAMGERGACEALAAYSDAACAPCAKDGVEACFALSLTGLRAD